MINSSTLLFASLSVIDGVFRQNSSEQPGHLLPIVIVVITVVYLSELPLFVLRKANRQFLKVSFQIELIYNDNRIQTLLVAVLVILVSALVILVIDHLVLTQYLCIV